MARCVAMFEMRTCRALSRPVRGDGNAPHVAGRAGAAGIMGVGDAGYAIGGSVGGLAVGIKGGECCRSGTMGRQGGKRAAQRCQKSAERERATMNRPGVEGRGWRERMCG